MEKPRPSAIAWGALISGVAIYDMTCPDGETMSEYVDSALENPRTRYLAIGAVAMTALHLLNVLPPKADPLHLALKWRNFTEAVEDGMEWQGDEE